MTDVFAGDVIRCLDNNVRSSIHPAVFHSQQPTSDDTGRRLDVRSTDSCRAARAGMTSLGTDDVITTATSGSSTLLLFYVALTTGASFAACASAVAPSWLIALVALTSLVSFAVRSAVMTSRDDVTWWRHSPQWGRRDDDSFELLMVISTVISTVVFQIGNFGIVNLSNFVNPLTPTVAIWAQL